MAVVVNDEVLVENYLNVNDRKNYGIEIYVINRFYVYIEKVIEDVSDNGMEQNIWHYMVEIYFVIVVMNLIFVQMKHVSNLDEIIFPVIVLVIEVVKKVVVLLKQLIDVKDLVLNYVVDFSMIENCNDKNLLVIKEG